jgi:predicted glycogen debranching enzyme
MGDLQMHPPTGTRLVRHVGDRLTIELRGVPAGWTARLRTNLGRARRQREEIVRARFGSVPLAGASWRDLEMTDLGHGVHALDLPLGEVGFFQAKAYALDPRHVQHWPEGPDLAVSIHPAWTRTGNTIYCAFPRMFGPNKSRRTTVQPMPDREIARLDQAGFAVIPPSGTFRDVIRELPHIVDTLGCRILHLLPVSPTPTTFARFGRFGSPYALQDLTAIDPALVEFDRRTTGVDQFCELSAAVHAKGARLMLDLVINHTGWGSTLLEQHSAWFVRKANGEFQSPGAWDVVWEDLVELDQRHAALWEHLAEAFLIWCRRGVDAFRCDAGYKVPTHVWQFITARVRQEFPDTVFLLEGLGGSWEATESLLTEGGMQWAYSELFQNYEGHALSGYLDHANRASFSTGALIHYSETHDNSRLAAKPSPSAASIPETHSPDATPNAAWSRHRNRLCALTSVNGGFAFTNGVEWLATEQINVHSARGLAWGSEPNLVAELAHLNRLLGTHPCFFDGAKLARVSPAGAPIYALLRTSADGSDEVLVLANSDLSREQSFRLDPELWAKLVSPGIDLLEPRQRPLALPEIGGPGWIEVTLAPGAVHCLARANRIPEAAPEHYPRIRARADWAFAACGAAEIPESRYPQMSWMQLAAEVDADPGQVLARASAGENRYAPVIHWTAEDLRRITPIPPGHWLLLRLSHPFRAQLEFGSGHPKNVASITANGGHVACFPPRQDPSAKDAILTVECFAGPVDRTVATVRYLGLNPDLPVIAPEKHPDAVALLANGRGGMSRLRMDLGSVRSKYDCLLGANLHPAVPADRHIFAKRLRAWVNADGFIAPLNLANLLEFEPGPPAHWRFVANAGDGRCVELHLLVDLLPHQNTVAIRFFRPNGGQLEARLGRPLPVEARVLVIARVDIEDRSFHWETKRNDGADYHFSSNCRQVCLGPAPGPKVQPAFNGFEFAPAADRQLRVWAEKGAYHHQSEWSLNIPHPVEASRGQEGFGDAFSPGWFEIPLPAGEASHLLVTAEPVPPSLESVRDFVRNRLELREAAVSRATGTGQAADAFTCSLVKSAQAYVVRRDDTKSVIAGYPWFLDWGRDSLIAARGLISAGLSSEVRDLLLTFGRFEHKGTLPNSIHGTDASNRDTSDAPLWFGIVCEELAASLPAPDAEALYRTPVDGDRTLSDVLRSIASGYLHGTANGIRVDHASGLVWSPSHFTWMDTNHPAGSRREGYPVEIEGLWIRLLQQLARLGMAPWDGRGESWADIARRAEDSLHRYFWLEECGWYADVLLAGSGTPARTAPPSNALRSNCLLLVSLGLNRHPQFHQRARRMVLSAARHLVVPGALRSLAPLPVIPPLPICGPHGQLLNDPNNPYWPRYEGDEDTRRKPAYHNGTAWTWTFPAFCEALALAFPDDAGAWAAARAYLGSTDRLLNHGCPGHLPEIVDGDAPHTQRGCDAQAWSVTETLRVWRWLNRPLRA